MASYRLDITEDAKDDLSYYTLFERKTIVGELFVQLVNQPDVETNSRKTLRENPIARWELKVGRYRVFYEIDSDEKVVSIVSVGHKDHNVLYIRGKVVIL